MMWLWCDKQAKPTVASMTHVKAPGHAIHLTKLSLVNRVSIGAGFDEYIEWLENNLDNVPGELDVHVMGTLRGRIAPRVWNIERSAEKLRKKNFGGLVFGKLV